MPPKSSKTVRELYQCVRCNCIVLNKELSIHKNECDVGKCLTHRHIVNQTLYGAVQDIPEGIIINVNTICVTVVHTC